MKSALRACKVQTATTQGSALGMKAAGTPICLIGAGFVGLALAEHLKEQGLPLYITTTTPSRQKDLESLADRVLLLGESGLLEWQAEIQQCQAVAVAVAPKERTLSSYQNCYVKTVEQLLEITSRLSNPPHILYTSSTSVYGEKGGAEVIESDANLDHLSDPYASILMEAEKKLLDAALPVTILRLGEILGPGRSLLARVKAMQGRAFSGDGSRVINVSHLNAIVKALGFCLQKRLLGVYNLCSASHPTRLELYTKLSKAHGLPPPHFSPQMPQHHPGNKWVVSRKIAEAGFCYPEEPLE